MKENLSRIVKDANVNSLRQLALTLEDLYKKDDKGNTLFLQAVFIKPRYKRQPILDEIFRQISALLSPQAADYVGTTLLHWAVMCNQTDATVREIFLKNPDNISFQNYYKQTPLHFAINYRYLNMVKMMVNLTGIEIDRNDLKLAIKLGYKEIVEFLISEKNPHHAQMMNSSKKHAEKTALTYAIQYGRTEIAELLISHDTVLQNKYLLLENAIKDNSIKAVETLIKEVEILPNKKNALLEIAINRGHIQSAECLINKGATLKEVSPFLKQAIDNNQLEVLKLLLREYKSIFNKNCDAAEDINLLEIIEPFVEYALKKGNSQISSILVNLEYINRRTKENEYKFPLGNVLAKFSFFKNNVGALRYSKDDKITSAKSLLTYQLTNDNAQFLASNILRAPCAATQGELGHITDYVIRWMR